MTPEFTGPTVIMPPGTCQCIWSKGAKLNAIKDKAYGGSSGSNSNAALNLLMGCCGVPTGVAYSGTRATAFDTPVQRVCGEICTIYRSSIVVKGPALCPLKCDDLK